MGNRIIDSGSEAGYSLASYHSLCASSTMSSSPVHNFIEDSSRILQQLVLGLFYVSLLLSGLLGNLSQYLIWAIWTYSSITELGQLYISTTSTTDLHHIY